MSSLGSLKLVQRLVHLEIKYLKSVRNSSGIALRPRKNKSEIFSEQNFVDWRKIKVIGGQGGDGASSFLQLWCNPTAGPDGGDGGNGGHIIFKASKHVRSLNHLESVYTGLPGEKGGNKECFGKNAKHTTLEVPVGTLLKDEKGKIVGDLDNEGKIYVAARGGAGGKGNQFFLSNENRAPVIRELGAKGESKTYVLELRLLADIGLIGFPNVGKSTLLRAISRAKPKIAAYPFTTLNPNIGIVYFDDYVQMSVADIPGLIQNAHKNCGLGFSFLRHIQRCSVLVYVIDMSMTKPWEQLEVLKYELEQYQKGLSQRPKAIVGNKIDLEASLINLETWQREVKLPILPISAKKGSNVSVFVNCLRKLYDKTQQSMANAQKCSSS